MKTLIVRVLTACVWVWVWPLAAAQTELSAITHDLPGNFEVERSGPEMSELLPGATGAHTTIFRTDRMGPDGTHLGMQYIEARYQDQTAADVEFEKIVDAAEDGKSPQNEWKIVLQAQGQMHWLQAACSVFDPSPAEYFRQAYSNLVTHAETNGMRANRALLCGCESSCMTVAIDR